MFNTKLADELAKLGTKPQDFKPVDQKPRCTCHNKYVSKCPFEVVKVILGEELVKTPEKIRTDLQAAGVRVVKGGVAK